MARGGSLYMEVQDVVEKELAVRFPREDFWIDDIFLEDDKGEEKPERLNRWGGEDNNPSSLVSTEHKW